MRLRFRLVWKRFRRAPGWNDRWGNEQRCGHDSSIFLAVPTLYQNASLLLCALIAPVPLARLTDVDELMVALGCRFALDVFAIAQLDYDPGDAPPAHSLQHGRTCTLNKLTSWLVEVFFFLKVHMNLTGFLCFDVRMCSPALRAPPRMC